MQLLVQSRARLRKNVLRAGRVHGSKPIDLNGRSKVRTVRIQRGSGAMVMKVGASKVGFAGGGGFGGTAMRYVLSVVHGYCFGYCVYVLAVKPMFISTRLAVLDRFPSLKEE
ncbi:unnamed protein product [Effrenium voratum]|nr:unnamed protein product [Effrenium voratum]